MIALYYVVGQDFIIDEMYIDSLMIGKNWNIQKLAETLPAEIVQHVYENITICNATLPWWMKTSGKFSLSSAWQLVR